MPRYLTINYIIIYNSCGSATIVVHLSNPLRLVICFELFCHAPQSVLRPEKNILSLLINISEIAVNLPFVSRLVNRTSWCFYTPQMPLYPCTNFHLFFIEGRKTRNIIITFQFVPKTLLFVINVFFHCVILHYELNYPYNSIILAGSKTKGRQHSYEASPFGFLINF